MSRIQVNSTAPDFTREDFNGTEVSLSSYKGEKNVLLVFNRGFV